MPYPAGGTTDLVARMIGQWLTERLGQPVVIENKPGGGTNIGVQAVVNAAPDGHTLLFTVSTNAINPSLYKSLPFDFQRDIAPVAGLAELPLVMVANPGIPAKTVAELIAHAKANPGKINIASFGARTISHLAIELIKASTGIDVVHVPYPRRRRDDGRSDPRPDPGRDRRAAELAAAHQVGAVRALAILPPARIAVLPDVPTIGETLPGLEASTWSGVGVPAGTPGEIIERLNREINAGLADSGIMARFADVGAVPLRSTPAELARIAATPRNGPRWSGSPASSRIEPGYFASGAGFASLASQNSFSV